MKELLRTNDPVYLSFAQAVLAHAGIETHVFDHFTSAVEGSISAVPRRLMVDEDRLDAARKLLADAEPKPDDRMPDPGGREEAPFGR
jgi:hypothetical protein